MALRKTMMALCMAAVCGVATAANAEDIAVVDLQSVLEKSPKLQAVKDTMKKQFASQSKAIESEQEALFKSLDTFRKNKSTLKPKDAEKQQKDLMNRQSQLVKKQQQFSEKVQKAQGEAMTKLYNDLQGVVKAVAKDNKVRVVLLKQAVVVADAPDLTPKVEQAFAKK